MATTLKSVNSPIGYRVQDYDNTIRHLMITQMKGIGCVTRNTLLKIYGGLDGCFTAPEEELLERAGRIGHSRIRAFIDQRNDEGIRHMAEVLYETSDRLGIDIITYDDDRFPERFRDIAYMPILLYIKGDLRINDYTDSIGIVGARRCLQEDKGKAIEIVTRETDKDVAVISGMAKGIDSYAHTAAVKQGKYTIAVLGNGIDVCYPREHEKLQSKIAENGCVLSEYPPGTGPRKYMFPMRNRIIAALSDRLYVIGAGRNSGTQSTVDNGIRFGREVIQIYGNSS